MGVRAAPSQNVSRERTSCQTCGAPAERGQLVCLECGARVSLAYRRPPSWKVAVAITALVLLLALVGAVLALRALGDEAKREVSAIPANPNRGAADDANRRATPGGGLEPPAGAGTEQEEATGEGSADQDAEPELGDDPDPDDDVAPGDDPATESGGIVKEGDLYAWPRSLRGFTVVLLSNEDRASATRFARSAADAGERIGVISSADFRTLPQGFFVVFAGKYASRAEADTAADRLAKRFPGAFPQLVQR